THVLARPAPLVPPDGSLLYPSARSSEPAWRRPEERPEWNVPPRPGAQTPWLPGTRQSHVLQPEARRLSQPHRQASYDGHRNAAGNYRSPRHYRQGQDRHVAWPSLASHARPSAGPPIARRQEPSRRRLLPAAPILA